MLRVIRLLAILLLMLAALALFGNRSADRLHGVHQAESERAKTEQPLVLFAPDRR